MDFLADLHGQFAGGAEHEDLRFVAINIDEIERRQAKGGRLTRACLREADDIFTRKRDRYGLGLNGRGRLIAETFDAFDKFGA